MPHRSRLRRVHEPGEPPSRGEVPNLASQAKALKAGEFIAQAALLDALPAHIATLDDAGSILSVNARWREFADSNGLTSPGHAVGMNYLEICEQAGRHGDAQALRAAEGIRSVLGGKTSSFSMDYPCHSSTELRWFHLTATPLRTDGSPGAIVAHTDVSRRALAESTTEWTPGCFRPWSTPRPFVFVKDLQGRYLLCNEAFARFAGRSVHEIVGKSAAALFPPEEAREGMRGDLEVIEARQRRFSETMRTGVDGARHLEVWKAPCLDDRGELIGVIGICRT